MANSGGGSSGGISGGGSSGRSSGGGSSGGSSGSGESSGGNSGDGYCWCAFHVDAIYRTHVGLSCLHIVYTSKEPVCPRVELILKIIIILLIIFLGFIKSKPC